jgi:hypothetical protein
MTRHPLKQMHANVGASARARATTSREVGQCGAAQTRARIHKATVVPPVSPARAGTLAPTLKSELWQRRAGVVIGNRSPARIGAYHSIFGRTECAPTALVGRNRGRGYKVLGAIVRTRQGENIPVPARQAARDRQPIVNQAGRARSAGTRERATQRLQIGSVSEFFKGGLIGHLCRVDGAKRIHCGRIVRRHPRPQQVRDRNRQTLAPNGLHSS